MKNILKITSVSWIEPKRLPHAGTMMALGGTPFVGSWANRVVMGLVATSNPTPEEHISVEAFRARKQFRALTHYELKPSQPSKLINQVIDPGYTPPFDKSKVDTWLVHLAPIPDAAKEFHSGENSALSGCVAGQLHPLSTLRPATNAVVIASALIKFRAGESTNNIGISDEVGSPVHVPWVWCEHALVKRGDKFILMASGSKFPSHAWYVNGKKVATSLQSPITVSEKEPAISTGRPKSQTRSDANADKESGKVTDHEFAIQAGDQIETDISAYVI